MLTNVDLLSDWKVKGQKGEHGYVLSGGIEFEFPSPENAAGWYAVGFERGNDSALDVMGWYGLELSIVSHSEETEISVNAYFMDNRTVQANSFVSGLGIHQITVRLSDFEIETSKVNIWRFLTRLQIQGNACLVCARLVRGKQIYVDTNILGKAGYVGERIEYTMSVYNCTDQKQSVSIRQFYDGWESLIAVVTPSQFVLAPSSKRDITVAVHVHDNMVPGGHENTRLTFIPNGNSTATIEVEMKTLRRLPHPYIYHNKEQWIQTKEKIDNNPKFKPGYDKIIADAQSWIVKPPIPLSERSYCYDTQEEHYVMSTAYAYALTGDIWYADKAASFFRYFIDEETGYPKRKKGCSQSYVQEGHFFQHLAIAYDIVHDAGVLSPEEHVGIEKSFRIYVDILDNHLMTGHISNWVLSEITGAFYCALAIQDIERALRFVFGPMGTIDHLKYGVFSDGWWHECSVSYNTWVSSMFLHTAHALLPFGYNILHSHFLLPSNDEVDGTYAGQEAVLHHGMYKKKWGGNLKGYICIKDLFDAAIPFLDYRGVLFGISDSTEKKLEGVHFGSTYDLAYHYYKDPEYIPVINQMDTVDPIFGHAELPQYESQYRKVNAFADNVGVAMLRSQTENRDQKDQIQAVIRYGSHGYAHGHFDRTGLLSLMRYGRSFFNPEHVWWGYAHFMYKFYVQNSFTKNMVTVDEKMQVPSPSKRLLFYSGTALQVTVIETVSTWAYPPYGGMRYSETQTLNDRCRMNASSLPKIENPPPYGELTEYTEPITQRRVMAVTDDYVVLFDFLEGQHPHRFYSLFQIKGYKELKATNYNHIKHTSQFTDNPLSDAQFITDCDWYEINGPSVAKFETRYGVDADMRGTLTAYNTPGVLKLDVHTAWPKSSTQIVGRVAENHGYTIPLTYQVETDGEIRAKGSFGAWILGEGRCEIDVVGVRMLNLRVRNHPVYNEQNYPHRTKQGLFWGEAYIVTSTGSRINLSDLDLNFTNIDIGYGIGKDYEGGRVTIIGEEYTHAIPTSPINHDDEGIIRVDLSKMDAVRFVGLIGADAFPGDESQRRKTYAVRSCGKSASYITIVEPYETESMIASVESIDENSVAVVLRDGRRQVVSVNNIKHENVVVTLKEYVDDQLLREEFAANAKE